MTNVKKAFLLSLTYTLLAIFGALQTVEMALFAVEIPGPARTKPNVLLIIADDLGLQLSCYGDTHINTLNGKPGSSKPEKPE